MKQSRERSSTTNSTENNQSNVVGGIQMPNNTQIGGIQMPSNTPVSNVQMPNNTQIEGIQMPNNTQIGGIQMPNNNHIGGIQMPSNSIELPISSVQNTHTTAVANNNINLPVSTIQDTSNRNSSIMSRIQNIGTPMMLPIKQQQNNQIDSQVVASSSSLTTFVTPQSFLLDQQQPMSNQHSVQQPISNQHPTQQPITVQTAQQPIMHALQQPMSNQSSFNQPMSNQSSFNQPMSNQSSFSQPMSRPDSRMSQISNSTLDGGFQMQPQQQYFNRNPTSQLSNQQASISGTNQSSEEIIPILMMESKEQNSQMRIVQHKLDHVSLLLHEMKQEVSNIKPNDLPNHQYLIKEKEALEEKLKQKVAELQNEKNTVTQLKNSSSQDSTLKEKSKKLSAENEELRSLVEQSKHQLTEMHTKLTNYKENKIILKETLNSEKHRADHNENKLKELQQMFSVVENEVEKLRSLSSNEENNKIIEQLQIENNRIVVEHSEQAKIWGEEKLELENKVESLKQVHEEAGNICREAQEKLTSVRANCESQKEELSQCHEKIQAYKERHDTLRSRAADMKQKYTNEIQRLQQVLQQEKQQSSGGDNSTEVKNIMNNVFQMLRSQVDIDERYSGKSVLEMSLKVIKSCTLQKLDENKRPDDQRKSEKKVSFSSDVPLASMGNSDKLNDNETTEASQEGSDNEEEARNEVISENAANETVHKQEEKTENNDEVEENSENDEENNVENIVTNEEIVEENSTVDDLLS